MNNALALAAAAWMLLAITTSTAQDISMSLTEPGDLIDSGTAQDIEYELEEELDEIETDRDSFTPATTTVGYRRWVFEGAYSFIDNRGVKETHSLPELVVRYGALDWLELRLGWNYEVGGKGSDISTAEGNDLEEGEGLETEGTISYGLKLGLTSQRGWRPQSALILMGFTPTAGESNSSTFVGTYVIGWTLPNEWVLDASLRYSATSEEGDGFGVWAPSVVLKAPVGERWKCHIEYFGLFSQNLGDNFSRGYVSPGAHYLITPNLEIGARFGWGITDDSTNFFVNSGVGWRY